MDEIIGAVLVVAFSSVLIGFSLLIVALAFLIAVDALRRAADDKGTCDIHDVRAMHEENMMRGNLNGKEGR